MRNLNEDVVVAAIGLAERSGAISSKLGYDCPHLPDAGDDHSCPEVMWHMEGTWKGARIIGESHPTPSGAALAFAERLLAGATCRCGAPVSLSDAQEGCRWQLQGPRWAPSCTAPPVPIAERGVLPENREMRRRRKKYGKKGK